MNGIPGRFTVSEGHLDTRISAHAQKYADLTKAVYLAVGHLHIVKDSRSIGIADHNADHVVIRLLLTDTGLVKDNVLDGECSCSIPDKTSTIIPAERFADLHIVDGVSLTVNGDGPHIHRRPICSRQINVIQQLYFNLVAGSFRCSGRRGHSLLERCVCFSFSLNCDFCNRIRHRGIPRIRSIRLCLVPGVLRNRIRLLRSRGGLLRAGLRFCLCRKRSNRQHRQQHTHCQDACQKLVPHSQTLLFCHLIWSVCQPTKALLSPKRRETAPWGCVPYKCTISIQSLQGKPEYFFPFPMFCSLILHLPTELDPFTLCAQRRSRPPAPPGIWPQCGGRRRIPPPPAAGTASGRSRGGSCPPPGSAGAVDF